MKSNGIVDQTPLWEDILSVIRVKDRKRSIHISAMFHTEKEDFPVMKILLKENNRDYYKSTGEYSYLTVYMAQGDYLYRLVPFRENIEITVKTTTFLESGTEDPETPPVELRYKALIDFETNPFPSSENISNRSNLELNNLPPITVKMELQDRCEELLRLKTLDGVFRNTTAEKMLRGAFVYEANKAKVDNKGIIQVLQLDEPDNKSVYPDLLIPHGTYLRDLPGYLQQKANGVYNAGIGSFFQQYREKPTWFVYPLYKKKRFDEDRIKLVIYAVPQDRLPTMNRTFRVEGKTIYIAATGEKKMADTSKNLDLNLGNAFRLPDQEAFMLKPVEILPTGIKANRKRLAHEVGHRVRKDQLNSARLHEEDTNPYMQYSNILSREFSALALAWENSDPELLYPGMPVKYIYMDRGEYTESKGTLVKAFTVSKLIGNPSQESNHSVSTQMVILLEPQDDLPDNDKQTSIGETR